MKSLKNIFPVLVIFFLFISCEKEKDKQNSSVEFSFAASSLKSATTESQTLSSLVVSVKSSDGTSVCTKEKIDLLNVNGDYISKPVSLKPGKYQLTEFLVSDSKGNIIYATPIVGSTLAYLVQNPLPVSFDIEKDKVNKVSCELVTLGSHPAADFGYATYSFNILRTFDILCTLFTYNDSIKNFELNSGDIKITSGVNILYNGKLDAVTNSITLNDGFESYTIMINKPGYKCISQTYTNADIKKYSSEPWTAILEKGSCLPSSGLVAYYPFNGNSNDLSGNNNNGTVSGAILSADRYGNLKSAYEFNGIDNYIRVPNSVSLQITGQITMSAWFKTSGVMPYAGIITKADPLEPRRGYDLTITDKNLARADIIFDHSTGADGAVFSTMTVTDNKWHHMLAVYDGTTEKLYIDGRLDNQVNYTKGMQINDEPLFIGWDQNTWLSTRHFKGLIDDIRIYNRALTEDEIIMLAKE